MIAVLRWTDGFGHDTYVKAIYPTLEQAKQYFSEGDRWVEFNYGLVDFDWYEANEFREIKHKKKKKSLDKIGSWCYTIIKKGEMNMDKEKLIARIMKECEQDGEPVTREEAEEMAEMEIKANGIKHYEKSDKPRKAVKKERKVDATKKRLLMDCKVLLEGLGAEILGVKTETEVTFTFEGEEYSLKLIKHRPKKE